jgi:hypothetical protein
MPAQWVHPQERLWATALALVLVLPCCWCCLWLARLHLLLA